MLIYEFVERTGYFPTSKAEWEQIDKEYTSGPEGVYKDEFCNQWVEKNQNKIKKQQETTTDLLSETVFDLNTSKELGRMQFDELIEQKLGIRKDIRGLYSYATTILGFMKRKSFGYWF